MVEDLADAAKLRVSRTFSRNPECFFSMTSKSPMHSAGQSKKSTDGDSPFFRVPGESRANRKQFRNACEVPFSVNCRLRRQIRSYRKPVFMELGVPLVR
jgi:hypothetical protein